MDYEKVKHLLDKYYDGFTILEEEKQLQDFLNSEKLLEEFKEEKEFFDSFNNLKKESIPSADLKEDIINYIEKHETDKRFKIIPLKWMSGIAASLLLLIGVYFGWTAYNKNTNQIMDEDIAYMETKKALLFISQKMNSNTNALSHLPKINKGLSSMKSLQLINKKLIQSKTEKK